MKLKLKNEKDMIIVIEKEKKTGNEIANFIEHNYCFIISQSYY